MTANEAHLSELRVSELWTRWGSYSLFCGNLEEGNTQKKQSSAVSL